jgi:hypothetical protein
MINEGESTSMEPTEPKRTRESEIKANVEFWEDIGHPISEESIKKAIEEVPEVEGYDWYIVIPKGIQLPDIYELIQKNNFIKQTPMVEPGWRNMMMNNTNWLSFNKLRLDSSFRIPESSNETYAVAAKFQQEPDADSLGENARSAKDWEKTNDHFMNPIVRLVAGQRYYQETGKYLDQANNTMSPHSVYGLSQYAVNIPFVYFDHGEQIDAATPYQPFPRWGVRRVITKDSKALE